MIEILIEGIMDVFAFQKLLLLDNLIFLAVAVFLVDIFVRLFCSSLGGCYSHLLRLVNWIEAGVARCIAIG